MNNIRKIEIRKARRLSICLLFLYLTAPGLHCCTQAFSSRGDLCSVSFSLRWLLLLCSTGSRGSGFSSSGTQAQLLYSMWDLPGLGIEPMSPALPGRFLSTGPPGKTCLLFLSLNFQHLFSVLQVLRLFYYFCFPTYAVRSFSHPTWSSQVQLLVRIYIFY